MLQRPVSAFKGNSSRRCSNHVKTSIPKLQGYYFGKVIIVLPKYWSQLLSTQGVDLNHSLRSCNQVDLDQFHSGGIQSHHHSQGSPCSDFCQPVMLSGLSSHGSKGTGHRTILVFLLVSLVYDHRRHNPNRSKYWKIHCLVVPKQNQGNPWGSVRPLILFFHCVTPSPFHNRGSH